MHTYLASKAAYIWPLILSISGFNHMQSCETPDLEHAYQVKVTLEEPRRNATESQDSFLMEYNSWTMVGCMSATIVLSKENRSVEESIESATRPYEKPLTFLGKPRRLSLCDVCSI